ncbi:MAG: hypothetical protein FJ145_18090 [Deltaproteobacteria bacterium]|nr:hypothetical protein [Deltaproteobacteria bacterium]
MPGWLMPNDGPLGHTNGGIAVRANGEIFVTHRLPITGIAVYAPNGTYLRNVANAPRNLHTILIRTEPEGEVLYTIRGGGAADTGPYSGSVATGPIIEKMTLDGEVVLSISASAIPDRFKDTELNKGADGALVVRMSGLAVAPNGDLYASDGYASDYIHRFDRAGKYLTSFGGNKTPDGFNRLHNLAIDTRFTPLRIIGTDQRNNRLVHWSLDGEFLGVFAADLRVPKDVAIDDDYAVVAEAKGRIAVLDRAGKIVTTFGTNTVEEETGTPNTPPAKWRRGIVTTPHAVALNAHGDVFVHEWNFFGRVLRFNRQE